jgi:hypothetical protein
MRRARRIAAGTLVLAALGIAGAQSGANASQNTVGCYHGITAPSSGHQNGVAYRGSQDDAGVHIHMYLHNPGGNNPHNVLDVC